jgi:hypothetical protein
MDQSLEYLVWLANTEFGGGSLNGPALLETLESLPLQEALSTDTYEGYSAWGVALHVLYFKYLVGRELGAKMPDYAYEEKGWPALPTDPDAEGYASMIAELKAFHEGVVTAVTAAPQKLGEPMPGWKMSIGKAFAWLVAHDTNHNTQIRNMGLASLREK